MPYKAPRPCRHTGCPEVTTAKDGYCDAHRKAEHKRYNAESRPAHHKLYRTRRWQQLRGSVLAVNPFCSRCGGLATLVHHIEPHNGDARLFYDVGNLESLCASCHNAEHKRGALA